MNDKLKIKIKVDIIGPINWTKEVNIDYNADVDYSKCTYINQGVCPFGFTIKQIQCAKDSLDALFNSMSIYKFKIIE